MRKEFILVIVLALFLIPVLGAPPDPGIVTTVANCTQSSNMTDLFSEYKAECYMAYGNNTLAKFHEFSTEIVDMNDNKLWHTQRARPVCLSNYEGGELSDGCFWISGEGGGAYVNLTILPMNGFEAGTTYMTEFYADGQENETSFVVTNPVLTVIELENTPNLGQDFYILAKTNSTAVQYFCDAWVYDNTTIVQHLPHVNVNRSDPFEYRTTTWGLTPFRVYNFSMDCSNAVSYNTSFYVGVEHVSAEASVWFGTFTYFLPQIALFLILMIIFAAFMFWRGL